MCKPKVIISFYHTFKVNKLIIFTAKSILMPKFLLFFFVSIFFWSCSNSPGILRKTDGKQTQISDSIEKNKELEDFISPYRKRIQKEMSAVLSYAPKAMFKSDAQLNTPLGNMMSDAVFEMANPIFEKQTGHKIDVVILNYGGIRSGINAGEVTTRTAYNIMPFENEVVIAELASEELIALVNYLVKNKVAHPIAGLQISLDAEGLLKEVKMNGEHIQNKSYYVATSDYLIKGGDRMEFFKKSKNVYSLEYKLRNLFIDYFKKKDTIAPKQDNRFTKLKN